MMLGVVFFEGRKIGETQAAGGTGENSLSGAVSSGHQCARLGAH